MKDEQNRIPPSSLLIHPCSSAPARATLTFGGDQIRYLIHECHQMFAMWNGKLVYDRLLQAVRHRID